MLFKTSAVLALATGLAAATPIDRSEAAVSRRHSVDSVALDSGVEAAVSRRQSLGGVGLDSGVGNNFDFVNGFNNFNNQQRVIQFQEQDVQIINDGFRQQVIEQAQNVLIVDNSRNGFRDSLDNVFRKSNFRNQFRDRTTVLLVVKEIQVAVDDGRGGLFEQSIYAQSLIVANRGARATETVQLLSQETLVAQNILGSDFRNFDRNAFLASQQGSRNNIGGQGIALPTKTNAIQLFAARPTWPATAADPAATLGNIWANEIADAQSTANDGNDNNLNSAAAAIEAQQAGRNGTAPTRRYRY